MKTIISGLELKNKIIEATNLLCNTVKSTLGPTGNNALIDSDLAPFITNDGVTIAQNIESEDKALNAILTILKEASLKTNELVGDGTTTTLVLLQKIIEMGFKKINEGQNPILLKKEIENATKTVIQRLQLENKKPNKKDYQAIASISANDKEIGMILSNTMFKMKEPGAIHIETYEKDKTEITIQKGYFQNVEISPIFFSNHQKKIILKNSNILIINGELNNIKDISNVLNESIDNKQDTILLVESITKEVENDIALLNIQKILKIVVAKIPDYTSFRSDILKDIELLTYTKTFHIGLDKTIFKFGHANEIIITNDQITIIPTKEQNIPLKKHIALLKKELAFTTSEYEKEIKKERLSKLKKGNCYIYVGAQTQTEAKEKKMRYDDALCALEIASKGVVLGSGLPFYKISEEWIPKTKGEEVIKEALKMPFLEIIHNTGESSSNILTKIKKENYQKVYNFETQALENIKESTILDSIEVLKMALLNASSIASILLTTNHLIINERQTLINQESI